MKSGSTRILNEILLITFAIVVIIRYFLDKAGNKEWAENFSLLSLAFGLSILVQRILYILLPKGFGRKPVLDEMEERHFGKK